MKISTFFIFHFFTFLPIPAKWKGNLVKTSRHRPDISLVYQTSKWRFSTICTIGQLLHEVPLTYAISPHFQGLRASDKTWSQHISSSNVPILTILVPKCSGWDYLRFFLPQFFHSVARLYFAKNLHIVILAQSLCINRFPWFSVTILLIVIQVCMQKIKVIFTWVSAQ